MDPRDDPYLSVRLVDGKTVFGDRKAGTPGLVPISNMQATRLEAQEPPAFPRRLQLGQRRVAWRLVEIIAWIESRQRGTLPLDLGTPQTDRTPRKRDANDGT
jgi:hypothetical protein